MTNTSNIDDRPALLWRGRDIRTMSREELIDVIYAFDRQHQERAANRKEMDDVLGEFAEARTARRAARRRL